VDEHYRKLKELGILTVRESIGWRAVKPSVTHTFNWDRVRIRCEAAKKHGIQIVWTFMHYGTPSGVNLLSDSFLDEFHWYAQCAAITIKKYDRQPIINLINEISFLAWATSQTSEMYPYKPTSSYDGFRTKCRLVKAVLRGMNAVRREIPLARFLHVEPLLHIVAPKDQPELEGLAHEVRGHQWQTWELLRGSMCPELGGSPEALDLMGVNYYYNGQMEVVTGEHLEWDPPDPRRADFSDLLREVWDKYQRPLIISETGHFDEGRSQWLTHILEETKKAMDNGVPLEGLCIYPVIDRPCWHDPQKILSNGLLDHPESIETLKQWQSHIQGNR